MNKNIFDVNYTIGKNTLVEKGTITKIEINGEDVPYDGTEIEDLILYGDGVEYTYDSTKNPKFDYS